MNSESMARFVTITITIVAITITINTNRSMKIMERIVNLNAEDEIFHDFKYFSGEHDGARDDASG